MNLQMFRSALFFSAHERNSCPLLAQKNHPQLTVVVYPFGLLLFALKCDVYFVHFQDSARIKMTCTAFRGFLILSLPPRPAELPGRQSPGVAHTGGCDVLLVAPDCCTHHALQAHTALLDPHQQRLSETDQMIFKG